jgi:hypothetical protein
MLCRIRGYISTLRKHGVTVLGTLSFQISSLSSYNKHGFSYSELAVYELSWILGFCLIIYRARS